MQRKESIGSWVDNAWNVFTLGLDVLAGKRKPEATIVVKDGTDQTYSKKPFKRNSEHYPANKKHNKILLSSLPLTNLCSSSEGRAKAERSKILR